MEYYISRDNLSVIPLTDFVVMVKQEGYPVSCLCNINSPKHGCIEACFETPLEIDPILVTRINSIPGVLLRKKA